MQIERRQRGGVHFRMTAAKALVGSIVIASAAIIPLAVLSSSASATTGSARSQQNAGGGSTTTLPAYAWSASGGTLPTIQKVSTLPDSATGCNQSVCIYLYGTGLVVNQWNTDVTSGSNCTQAAYHENSSVIAVSNILCDGPGYYLSEWSNPGPDGGYFPNNTKLCNTWLNNRGYPCEYVHS
jgi:hypothetical protein